MERAQIPVRNRILRLGPHRLFEQGAGFRQAPVLRQQKSQIPQCLPAVRVQKNGFAERSFGGGAIPLPEAGRSQIEMGRGQPRILGDRGLVLRRRRVQFALRLQIASVIDPNIRPGGLRGQRALVQIPNRCAPAPQPFVRLRQGVKPLRFGFQRHGLLQRLRGAGHFPQLHVPVPPEILRFAERARRVVKQRYAMP